MLAGSLHTLFSLGDFLWAERSSFSYEQKMVIGQVLESCSELKDILDDLDGDVDGYGRASVYSPTTSMGFRKLFCQPERQDFPI